MNNPSVISRSTSCLVLACLALTAALHSTATAQTTATYQGTNTTNSDRWNLTTSWSTGAVPTGNTNVIIPANKTATAWSTNTPGYTGSLSIAAGALLQMGWTDIFPASFNALGTPGTTVVTLAAGSMIKSRSGSSFALPEIQLTGNATVRLGESTAVPSQAVFDYPVTGSHGFTIQTNAIGGNGGVGIELNAANSFSSLTIEGLTGRSNPMPGAQANAPGSLGSGDVTTIGTSCPQIQFNAPNPMTITSKLILNGGGPSGNGNDRVLMNQNATIGGLSISGVQQAPGIYTNSQPWLDGPGTLTVLLISPNNPDPAFGKIVPLGNVNLAWTNLAPTTGTDVWVDVWFGTSPGSLTQVATKQQNITSFTVNAPATGTYYWRADSYLGGTPTGAPQTGGVYHFVVNDTDADGMPDAWEVLHTTPSSTTALLPGVDQEPDLLTNLQEYLAGTNPLNPDTDTDTLLDGWETKTGTWVSTTNTGTSPLDTDSDDDGLLDGVETKTGIWVSGTNTGTNPNIRDSDSDGLIDSVETTTGSFVSTTNTGTNPNNPDSDADGAGDWYEVANIGVPPGPAQPNNPNNPALNPGVPYPLPAHDGLPGVTNKKVKVYILSGQSNMVGFGQVLGTAPGTLATITGKENKFPNLVAPGGGFVARNDVHYRGVISAIGDGPLAPKFGRDGGSIGPELGFGQIMGWYHDEPVLIIKASIGNRSLLWDILPTGSQRFDYTDGNTYAGYGDTTRVWPIGSTPVPGGWYAGKEFDRFFLAKQDWAPAGAADNTEGTGYVLDNFAAEYPAWAAQGFEIAGFGWFHGFNDAAGEPNAIRYQQNLVQLIKQLRLYYQNRYPGKVVPNAPFAIATYAVGGWSQSGTALQVANAQLAVDGAAGIYPEFVGNVKTMDARGYWREVAQSPSAEGYHYNWNAETYMLTGDALGRAMVSMQNDVTPPFPSLATFAIAPAAVVPGTIGMSATTALDASGPVEYYFENITNSNNSAWTTTPSWANTGLTNGVNYIYRVRSRDALGNTGNWSAELGATAGTDATPPTPSPLTFATPPAATGETSVTMTAATATDINGVEYFFDATDGGHDSTWQDSRTYTDTGLTYGTTYTYQVRARDKSPAQNATAFSATAAATTATPDTAAPTPNPLTFATPPTATGLTSITMTAATATDPSSVEYRFNNVTLTTNSGWQNSPTYQQTGLTPATPYTYTVQARDKSPAQNTTTASAQASATTLTPDTTIPAVASLSPTNGSPSVAVTSNLLITFSENVKKGTGNIVIRESGGAAFETIAVSSASVTIVNAIVTINPTNSLAGGAGYYIEIANGAILDLADNPFPGISGNSTWSFITSVPGEVALYTGTNGAYNSDRWNTAANWSPQAFPSGTINVEIEANRIPWAVNTTPAYTGNLILRSGATLGIGPTTGNNTVNALGTGTITMENGSKIIMRYGASYTFNQAFVLTGPATVQLSESTSGGNASRTFSSAINGAHAFTLLGTNGNIANLNTANAFASLTASVSGSANYKVVGNAAGSLGTGNVTVNAGLNLVIANSTAMSQSASLYLNGVRSTKVTGEAKLVLSQSLTVAGFWLDGVQLAAGTYSSASGLVDSGANALISGGGTLTVTGAPPGSPFANWADDYPGLTNTNASLDFDGGSLPAGIEWVVGGNPSIGSDDSTLAPTIDRTTDPNGKLLFIFRRTTAAKNDANTIIAVEYGSTLAGWTPAVHQGTAANQITITEQTNGFSAGIDRVTVALPPSLAATGKFFARLKVVVVAQP